ncbi:MAG: hypothetical protein Q7T86_07800, partial [Hyphomicrobiaceae bacterium]|nr:hypothetical protein [Hyphomicrobiaceae bacterium]
MSVSGYLNFGKVIDVTTTDIEKIIITCEKDMDDDSCDDSDLNSNSDKSDSNHDLNDELNDADSDLDGDPKNIINNNSYLNFGKVTGISTDIEKIIITCEK